MSSYFIALFPDNQLSKQHRPFARSHIGYKVIVVSSLLVNVKWGYIRE